MKKSFRNLILSLFLAAGAAGLAACEGERGPIGEAGPAGADGADGAKGAAGDPGEAGKDFYDLPRPYEFIKVWGKADGMAACSDDIFNEKMPAAFPGPPTSELARTGASVPRMFLDDHRPNVQLGTPGTPAHEGRCSNKVFGDTTPFIFTHNRGNNNKMKEPSKKGKTAVLENPTLTTAETEFWGGKVEVELKPEAVEIEEIKTLLARCGVGEEASGTTKKLITGEYRVAVTTETEDLLAESGGTVAVKTPASTYRVRKYTTKICMKFPFAPGAVKCLVKTYAEKRNPSDDKKASSVTVTERMTLYEDGKLTPVAPMPYANGLLAGIGLGSPNARFPFGAGGRDDPRNLRSAAKLCNFFADGVIPCSSGKVAHPNHVSDVNFSDPGCVNP